MPQILLLKLLHEIVAKKLLPFLVFQHILVNISKKRLLRHELGKRCAAGVSIICIEKKQKIIHIQGESTEKIIEYLIQLKIPEEKIKICGIY